MRPENLHFCSSPGMLLVWNSPSRATARGLPSSPAITSRLVKQDAGGPVFLRPCSRGSRPDVQMQRLAVGVLARWVGEIWLMSEALDRPF